MPASKRCGRRAERSIFSNVTDWIMSPPPCQGGIASRIARLAIKPADAGRPIKSYGRRRHRNRSRVPARRPECAAAAWQPSSSTFAPCACARRTIAAPAEHAGRIGDMGHRDQFGARAQQPLERVHVEPAGAHPSARPAIRTPHPIAQELPWHDIGVMLHLGDHDLDRRRCRNVAPQQWATRLIASVAPRTKTISLSSAALRNRRTVSRACSYRSVERALSR